MELSNFSSPFTGSFPIETFLLSAGKMVGQQNKVDMMKITTIEMKKSN